MKKLVAVLCFTFIILRGTTLLAVFAQTPAPIPAGEELGNPNSFVTTKLPFDKAVQALAGKIVNFNIIGDVITEVTKPDEVNVTDMSPFNTWLANPFRLLNPFLLKNNSIPYTEENPESGRWCAQLVIKSNNVVRVREDYVTEPNTVHMSANIPWSQELYTYGQDLAAKFSGYRIRANADGKIDYNSSKKYVKTITTQDCGPNYIGVEHEPVKVDARTRAAFGEQSTIQTSVIQTLYDYIKDKITGFIEKVIATMGVTMEVRLTKKTQISNSPLAGCLLGIGCTDKENAPQVTNHSKTPNDGMPAMLVAFNQRKNPIGYGGSTNAVHLGGDASRKPFDYVNPEAGINRAYESLRQADCSVTPNKFIPTRKIGGVIPIADACAPKPTPPAGGWNCNTNVGEQSVGGLNKEGGKHFADNAYASCSDNDKNAWVPCNNDVIARAKKAGIDPIFALAIWLHESAASSYTCGEQVTGSQIEDFGIHTAPNVSPENFSQQLDYFLTLSDKYAGCGKTMENFVSMFWFGKCANQTTPEEHDKVTGYISELSEIYDSIAPGVSLPTWPK